MTPKEYALIVAGGKGTRFGSALPKQFLDLNGKPVLLHTVEAFFRYSENIGVVLVLPEEDISLWHETAKKYRFEKTLTIQSGGPTRFHSVKRGLEKIGDTGFVAIHDGVRPLVTSAMIAASFSLAKAEGSAIAAVHMKESIRRVDEKNGPAFPFSTSKAVDRALYKTIQTPQTFDVAMIKEAYARQNDPLVTDDAEVAERAGHRVFLFEGSYENIKITTPGDLIIAAALHSRRRLVE
ncbi:MAG TPA: 2-C-methyl-D-erythritol 4-phosphate cytidylyltransferase [Chryseosolibacter sp.]